MDEIKIDLGERERLQSESYMIGHKYDNIGKFVVSDIVYNENVGTDWLDDVPSEGEDFKRIFILDTEVIQSKKVSEYKDASEEIKNESDKITILSVDKT